MRNITKCALGQRMPSSPNKEIFPLNIIQFLAGTPHSIFWQKDENKNNLTCLILINGMHSNNIQINNLFLKKKQKTVCKKSQAYSSIKSLHWKIKSACQSGQLRKKRKKKKEKRKKEKKEKKKKGTNKTFFNYLDGRISFCLFLTFFWWKHLKQKKGIVVSFFHFFRCVCVCVCVCDELKQS